MLTTSTEAPSTKAIQERYTKLRVEQTALLQKMKADDQEFDVDVLPWTPEKERKLLLIWGGKAVSVKEYGQIAALFSGKFTT